MPGFMPDKGDEERVEIKFVYWVSLSFKEQIFSEIEEKCLLFRYFVQVSTLITN